jgi:hypothetical protein
MAHGNSPHNTSIHIIDDDSLLNIFYLYRQAIFDGDEAENVRISGGRLWDRERWWYKLAQVCQRWRNVLLGSASYLGLSLICTEGTPVVDMTCWHIHLPSPRHRLPSRRLGRLCRRRRNSPRSRVASSHPPFPPSGAFSETAEAHYSVGRRISGAEILNFGAPVG